MNNTLFSRLFTPQRTAKPRESGVTVIVDHGLGLMQGDNFFDTAADYVDVAKIGAGIAALIKEERLREKIESYHENDIWACPGGQFLEYAFGKNKVREYFDAARAAGFKCIEVSDNRVDISPQEKANIIRSANEEYGFKVFGETGSKRVASKVDNLIQDIQNCLNSGAWKVMVEAAELFEAGAFKSDLIEAITQEIDIDKLVFELPGDWIPGTTISDIYSLQVWLIEQFGTDVNIANVNPAEVLNLEAERNNLGAHMTF